MLQQVEQPTAKQPHRTPEGPSRKLVIRVEGATAEEAARGLAAAQAVFDGAGVAAWEAAEASHARDSYWRTVPFLAPLQTGLPLEKGEDVWEVAAEESAADQSVLEPTFNDNVADLWAEAEKAALEACCAGWRVKPDCAGLELPHDTDAERGDYTVRLIAKDSQKQTDLVRKLGVMTLTQAIAQADEVWASDPRVEAVMQGYWISDAEGRLMHSFNHESEQEYRKLRTGTR
jgi:hypothetical protein